MRIPKGKLIKEAVRLIVYQRKPTANQQLSLSHDSQSGVRLALQGADENSKGGKTQVTNSRTLTVL